VDGVTLTSAFLAGLLGSGHCAVMCGGIAVAFTGLPGVEDTRQVRLRALRMQIGRVASYTLAGVIMASIGLGLATLADPEPVTRFFRVALGGVLILAGLQLMRGPGKMDWLAGPGRRVWQRLQPLTRHFLPVNTPWRAYGLGALWGWLPCGLVYTLLLAAWFSASPLHGGALMLAFGLGTLPALMAISLGAAGFQRRLQQHSTRIGLGLVVMLGGLVTALAPVLVNLPVLGPILIALGCKV